MKIAENRLVEVHVQGKSKRYEGGETIMHAKHALDPRASYALELARHFAIVAGEPDGIDESGRQKFKLMSAEQVAERACSVAAAVYDEIEGKGWAIPIPGYEEVKAHGAREEATQD